MRTTLPTWKSALGAVAVAGAALLATAPPALAQDGGGGPDPTTAPVQERVSAEVRPGVVYLKTDVHAYLRNISDGSLLGPYDLSMQCTGFVVNPNGYIATAGHCVSDLDIQEELATEIANQYAAYGYDANELYQDAMVNYKLEGTVGGSPADKTVTAARASEGTGQTPVQAQIVDSKANADGDVALLKVNATNLPTVAVAPPGSATTGTQVMSIGYPGAVTDVMDPSLEPTFKDGSVSSAQNRNGIPFLQITADMGAGMSGGPTVNQQGQVVGINSMGTSDRADSFNFVAPNTTLLEMMARNGVPAQAGAFDTAYRAGLADYYQGYYSDAEDEFAQVLDIDPTSRIAAEYKSKAARAHDQFGDKGLGLLGWGLIGGGVFLVVVGGVVTAIVVTRRGRRNARPEVAVVVPNPTGYPMPGGQAPGYVPTMPQAPQGQPVPQQRGPQYPAAPPFPTTPQAPAGFGSAPFGQAPLSPAHGIPAVSGHREQASQAPAAEPMHPAPAVAVATPPRGVDTTPQAPPAPHAPAAPGHCSHCGAARAVGTRFCGGCGVSFT